jgi:hypothetical protein
MARRPKEDGGPENETQAAEGKPSAPENPQANPPAGERRDVPRPTAVFEGNPDGPRPSPGNPADPGDPGARETGTIVPARDESGARANTAEQTGETADESGPKAEREPKAADYGTMPRPGGEVQAARGEDLGANDIRNIQGGTRDATADPGGPVVTGEPEADWYLIAHDGVMGFRKGDIVPARATRFDEKGKASEVPTFPDVRRLMDLGAIQPSEGPRPK